MQLGMIGLGRMGANMVRRLIKGGHQCVVFDMSPKVVQELVQEQAVGAGVSALVAGSAIFGHRDGVAAALKRLRAAVETAMK